MAARMKKSILLVGILIWAAAPTSIGVIYVDANATGLDNGSSWGNAYKYLQDALSDADAAVKPVEVRVAQGTYTPDQGRSIKAGDRMAAFPLKDGTSILGGFAGTSGEDPNARDPNIYSTILSGDLKGNDVWMDMTMDVPPEVQNSHSDNSECIVDARSSGTTAILDGVQIKGVWYTEVTAGRSNPGHIDLNRQGGLFVNKGYPTIHNCAFTQNLSCSVKSVNHGNPTFTACRFARNHYLYAPAIYANVSDVTISKCVFESNVASREGGAIVTAGGMAIITDSTFLDNVACQFAWSGGGAILNWSSDIRLAGCEFRNNRSESEGGAVAGGVTALENCTFFGNGSRSRGGAVYGLHLTVRGCIFSFNTATSGEGGAIAGSCSLIANSLFTANQSKSGGAISCTYRQDQVIENCVFAGNRGRDHGGAIQFEGPGLLTIDSCSMQGNLSACGNTLDASDCDVTVRDSIIWDANAFSTYKTTLAITYSDLYDPYSGLGNVSIDPRFAILGYWDPNDTLADTNDDFWVEGDYHLKSQAGRWDPNSQSWVTDDVTSPCIDAGDPNSPVGDEPEPNGQRINMGAYGGTSEASKSRADPLGGADVVTDADRR